MKRTTEFETSGGENGVEFEVAKYTMLSADQPFGQEIYVWELLVKDRLTGAIVASAITRPVEQFDLS